MNAKTKKKVTTVEAVRKNLNNPDNPPYTKEEYMEMLNFTWSSVVTWNVLLAKLTTVRFFTPDEYSKINGFGSEPALHWNDNARHMPSEYIFDVEPEESLYDHSQLF